MRPGNSWLGYSLGVEYHGMKGRTTRDGGFDDVFGFGGEAGVCGGVGCGGVDCDSFAYLLLDTCPALREVAPILHIGRVALTWFIVAAAVSQAPAFPQILAALTRQSLFRRRLGSYQRRVN